MSAQHLHTLFPSDSFFTAHSDFVQTRLNGQDSTGDQTLNPARTSKKSGINKTLLYGICGGLLALGLLLMAYACFLRRRNGKQFRKGAVYRPLASPTPPVDMSIMHQDSHPPPRYSLPPQYGQPPEGQLYDPHSQPGAPSQAHLYDPQPGPYSSQQPVPASYHTPWEGRPQ